MVIQSTWLFTTEQVTIVKKFKRAQAFVKTSCLLLSCCMQYMDVAVMSGNLILLHISVPLFCLFQWQFIAKGWTDMLYGLPSPQGTWPIQLIVSQALLCASLLGLSSSFEIHFCTKGQANQLTYNKSAFSIIRLLQSPFSYSLDKVERKHRFFFSNAYPFCTFNGCTVM